MKLTIEGEAREIANFVFVIQERRELMAKSKEISPELEEKITEIFKQHIFDNYLANEKTQEEPQDNIEW